MKIRIRGQSLRFRLGQSEVSALAKGKPVEESITLAPSVRQVYVLNPNTTEQIQLRAEAGRVTVNLPARLLPQWATSDEVGLTAEYAIGQGQCVSLLIEKDFACIDNPAGESQADAFPNPKATC